MSAVAVSAVAVTPQPANVALIGFMGAGKTTVGAELARRLGQPFVDTDQAVVQAAGMPVAALFAVAGERGFREREAQAVEAACAGTGQIIAVGGGALGSEAVRNALTRRCLVVLLTGDPAALAARTAGTTGRPLLDGIGGPDERQACIERMLREREPLYQAARDLEVDTGPGASYVVETILAHLAGCIWAGPGGGRGS